MSDLSKPLWGQENEHDSNRAVGWEKTEIIYHNLPTDLTEKALETVNICRRTDVFVSIYWCNHAIRIHACAVLIYTVNAAAASTITTDFSSVTNQSSRDSTHRNDRSVIIYFTSMCFQTCSSFFLQLSTKEDVLKDVGNQTVDGSHWLPLYGKNDGTVLNSLWYPSGSEMNFSIKRHLSPLELISNLIIVSVLFLMLNAWI